MRKRYILWDNDGVLVDTEPWYFKATQRALGELGVELDEATYQQRMVVAYRAGSSPRRRASIRSG